MIDWSTYFAQGVGESAYNPAVDDYTREKATSWPFTWDWMPGTGDSTLGVQQAWNMSTPDLSLGTGLRSGLTAIFPMASLGAGAVTEPEVLKEAIEEGIPQVAGIGLLLLVMMME